jgi:23S rRNA (guanosine2251-2'-O)-methyltransferase
MPDHPRQLTKENDPSGPEVEVILDNIRSAYNVGSIFRTADGANARHIHLCGITPSPDHVQVQKTALGAQWTVPWTVHWNALEAARSCIQKGMRLWILEYVDGSRSIYELEKEVGTVPIALVVGNEIGGVDPSIMALSEQVIHIPMLGSKRSLNVSTAFGIAFYHIRFAQQ